MLVSTNGKVEKAKWEYLGNKSLLIDKGDGSYLFKHGFFDQDIFALKVDSSDEYAVFVNENNSGGELNSIDKVIDFLSRKYLDPSVKKQIEDATGRPFVNQEHVIIKTPEQIEKERKEFEDERDSYEVFAGIAIVVLIILALFIFIVETG